MAGGVYITVAERGLFFGNFALHGSGIWQAALTSEQFCHPGRLHLSQGHDGAKWLDEANEVQARVVGVYYFVIKRKLVVLKLDETGLEKGEGDGVASGVDDGVNGGFCAIGEAHFVACQFCDVGFDGDGAVGDEVEQFGRHGGVGRENGVVWFGDAIVLLVAHSQKEQNAVEEALQGKGQS